ncbi:hypothetical protein CEXT_596911 [Caerostris extrusa]|uniref:Uncharacterized protein n=1 Tax=Caerostris extrusa TaxID=172846 RepID=A0AAV4TCC8_CAEEX|nr:hypothetical protein CEXT_596911 [Caerostris extrusa]
MFYMGRPTKKAASTTLGEIELRFLLSRNFAFVSNFAGTRNIATAQLGGSLSSSYSGTNKPALRLDKLNYAFSGLETSTSGAIFAATRSIAAAQLGGSLSSSYSRTNKYIIVIRFDVLPSRPRFFFRDGFWSQAHSARNR